MQPDANSKMFPYHCPPFLGGCLIVMLGGFTRGVRSAGVVLYHSVPQRSSSNSQAQLGYSLGVVQPELEVF